MAAPVHTDDNAWLEYRTPWAFAALNSVALAVENLAALLPLQRPVTEVVTTLTPPERESLARVSEAARWLWERIVARARGDLEYARESDTPGKAGGLMSGAASKAVGP